MNKLRLTAALWEAAVPLADYAAAMTQYREHMQRRLAYVALKPGERALCERAEPVRYVLAMTEDWCGDALFILPVVARMAAAMPHAELGVVRRAEHAALNAHYEARGITHVPVLSFFVSARDELATWEERAQRATARFEAWKTARPDFLALRYAEDIPDDEKKRRLEPHYARLLDEMFTWYDGADARNLQRATVDELVALLAPQRSDSR